MNRKEKRQEQNLRYASNSSTLKTIKKQVKRNNPNSASRNNHSITNISRNSPKPNHRGKWNI